MRHNGMPVCRPAPNPRLPARRFWLLAAEKSENVKSENFKSESFKQIFSFLHSVDPQEEQIGERLFGQCRPGSAFPGTGVQIQTCGDLITNTKKYTPDFTDENERSTLIFEGLMKKNHQDFSSCKTGSVKSGVYFFSICSGREQSLYLYPCPRGGGSGTALPEGAFPDLLFRPAPTE